MSKKANPTLIGTFVVGAIALAITATVIIGNIHLREKTITCVLYFSGSLHGLDLGAPVTFRGVQIGKVSSIKIDFDPEQSNYIIPVYIEIEHYAEDKGQLIGQRNQSIEEWTQELIEKGLRAKLKMRSVVTGKLYIDLSFYPTSEITLRDSSTQKKIIEIPTLPSGMEQVTQLLTELPLHEIVKKTDAVLNGLDRIINSESSKKNIASFNSSLENLEAILVQTRQSLPGLSADLKKGLASFNRLSNAATSLITSVESSAEPIATNIEQMTKEMQEATEMLKETLAGINELVGKDSQITYDIGNALRQLDATAHSIQLLTDYLSQHPNAIIFGK